MIPVLDLYSDCFGVVWYWYLKVVWQAILILSQTSGQAVTHPSRAESEPAAAGGVTPDGMVLDLYSDCFGVVW